MDVLLSLRNVAFLLLIASRHLEFHQHGLLVPLVPEVLGIVFSAAFLIACSMRELASSTECSFFIFSSRIASFWYWSHFAFSRIHLGGRCSVQFVWLLSIMGKWSLLSGSSCVSQ